MRFSCSQIGANVAWPAWLAITTRLSEWSIRHATPSPLPGLSAAIGAPASGLPPPICAKSVDVRLGSERATASKSLTIRTCRPNPTGRALKKDLRQGCLDWQPCFLYDYH